jgi:uncharacterized protein (TIGR02147 family)
MSRAAEYLLTQYHSRKIKNPRYSQRAFASFLGLNSGRLNQYFNGKRKISRTAAKSISAKLGLDAAETNYFLHLIELDKSETNSAERILTDDETALVVEWHHAALLALLTTQNFKPDPNWIAERLLLPVEVVKSSIERLQRIGLIETASQGYRRKPGAVKTTTNISSHFLRLSHKDILRKVIADIDTVPIECRDVTSITFAMDIAKVPIAKKMISDFRIRLAKRLTKGPKNQVVGLNIQLFPFTKVDL